MKTLLVHLHVYYYEQIDYFISKLKNINGCEWDLVVSCSNCADPRLEKLKQLKSDMRLLEVENVGYDVWPFIKVLKLQGTEEYPFILKLHTKNVSSYVNTVNGLKLSGERWRAILVDSLLGSPQRFADCLQRMESEPKSGFVYAYEVKRTRSKGMSEIPVEARRIAVSDIDGEYASGTMFLARTEALKLIAEADISAEMFAKDKSKSHSRTSLAHVYEQLLCFAMQDAGYKALRVSASTADSIKVCMHRMMSPVLKFIFSLEREGVNDSKVLTIFGIKIQIDPI